MTTYWNQWDRDELSSMYGEELNVSSDEEWDDEYFKGEDEGPLEHYCYMCAGLSHNCFI
jgi:hypothetical protein